MSEKPISPLRQRMIEDMTVRRFNEKTQSNYIRQVKSFTVFLGRSPDQATAEDLPLRGRNAGLSGFLIRVSMDGKPLATK